MEPRPHTKRYRFLLHIGLPVVVVAATAMTAHAYDTSWISSGQAVSAGQLKADLDEVQTRLPAAWVAFDGTTCKTGNSVCTILASYNVSSVVTTALYSQGVTYTISFKTPMPDVKYATFGTVAEANVCTHLTVDAAGPPVVTTSKDVNVVSSCAGSYTSNYVNVSFWHP